MAGVLGLGGIGLGIAHEIVQMRSGESALWAFLPIVGIVVSLSISFDKEIIVAGIGVLTHASMDTFERGEGVRFAIADDGRFHPRVRIDGASVDFVVDTDAVDIVLTPEDARRIGIDPSSLSFDQEIKTASGTERAAGVRVRRIEILDSDRRRSGQGRGQQRIGQRAWHGILRPPGRVGGQKRHAHDRAVMLIDLCASA